MTEKYNLELQDAIRHTHGCASSHVQTVPIKESFQGKTIWEGEVEVFALQGHATAPLCYAWGYSEGGKRNFVAVLHQPPVTSPRKAVQAYIVSQAK